MVTSDDIARYRENWQDEIDSAALYNTLADVEEHPQLAGVYRRLALVEDRHARFWEQKLQEAGQPIPPRRPGWRTRTLSWLARRLGPQFVLPTVASMEQVNRHIYDRQPETRQTSLPADEHSHARLLHSLVKGTRAGLEGRALARLEGRHGAMGSNALRAAVLGANDGLVSNLSLVMGMAGAEVSGHGLLLTGLAGLLAGACSMAMGEWLSVQSARELAQRQLAIEAAEITAVPDEEREELALIYQAKGLSEEEANKVAAEVMADADNALDTLAREELGIDPQELAGSAWEAAGTSFLLFALGAIIPVGPFLFLTGGTALVTSLGVSALALWGIGAAITLVTGRSAVSTGLRQLLFGLAAAALTYSIGRVLGVTLAG